MCGIVGYLGNKSALKPVVDGLKSLEYRGYDSAGVAYLSNSSGEVIKQVGRVEKLEKALEAIEAKPHIAIGHTRWATHGAPTTVNAHPHFNTAHTIFAVHNGIIENFAEIKAMLENAGYSFVSQTDTEVIPQLIDYYMAKGKKLAAAFEYALQDLKGAYAVAVISTSSPETIYAARLSSPLVLGVGKKEFILASDPTAIMAHTKDVVYLDDYEMVIIKPGSYKIKNFKRSKEVKRPTERLDFDLEQASLGHYPNFMLKEIFEAPQTIKAATLGRINPAAASVKLGGLESVLPELDSIKRIQIVACGTSYYAGLVGEYLIEELANIPVDVQLASEYKYKKEPFLRGTAVLAISQSGETADTIAALKKVQDYGALRLGVVNAVGSTIARMTDAGVYCHAGPEQAVASTKAFIAQVSVLTLIALHLSRGNNSDFRPLLKELDSLPTKAQQVLDQAKQIEKLAKKYNSYRDFLYIGRGYGYPCALEGALKLKEISYIHAEGYAGGEMKHGPLAMIDKDFATLAIIPSGELSEKIYSNIQEIKARGGPVIAIAPQGNRKIKELADDVIYIPRTLEPAQPILSAIVMQLFAYYVAIQKGKDVDKPRNLAKSVTVE